jgi:hypothetical protein
MTDARRSIERLDAVAADMEIKWGVGRLPELVAPSLADKFHQQQAILDTHIEAKDAQAAADAADAMVRAWQALDSAAQISGALPIFQTQWQGTTPAGQKVRLVRQAESSLNMLEDGELMLTFDEVLLLVDKMPDLLREVKAAFPSTITRITDKPDKPDEMDWERGDEIPFD